MAEGLWLVFWFVFSGFLAQAANHEEEDEEETEALTNVTAGERETNQEKKN